MCLSCLKFGRVKELRGGRALLSRHESGTSLGKCQTGWVGRQGWAVMVTAEWEAPGDPGRAAGLGVSSSPGLPVEHMGGQGRAEGSRQVGAGPCPQPGRVTSVSGTAGGPCTMCEKEAEG